MNLHQVDMNCNDCKHLQRFEVRQDSVAATSPSGKPVVFYGHCLKKVRVVVFMPATCMPSNDSCFVYRRDS